jgi:hypothetical protein
MRKMFYAASLALMAAACAPATVQTARTNGQGNFQFAVEPGVLGAAAAGGSAVGPSLNLAGRYGVSDRVDVGGRLGTSLYEVQVKAMLSDPSATDSMAVSIAPSTTMIAGGIGGVGAFYLREHVPVLFGLPTGGGSEFTFGPSATINFVGAGAGGNAAGGLILGLGGQVGYAARLGDKFRLVPQFDLSVPVVGAAAGGGEGGVGAGVGGAIFGLQLGLLFGGYP